MSNTEFIGHCNNCGKILKSCVDHYCKSGYCLECCELICHKETEKIEPKIMSDMVLVHCINDDCGRYDTPFYIKTEELMDKRLKHKFKHIHFVEASGANVLVNGKTAYECRNNRTKAELAIIFWYLPWKEYCFTQSAQGVIFNNTCLQDVQNFIEQLNAIEQN